MLVLDPDKVCLSYLLIAVSCVSTTRAHFHTNRHSVHPLLEGEAHIGRGGGSRGRVCHWIDCLVAALLTGKSVALCKEVQRVLEVRHYILTESRRWKPN